MEVHLLRVEQLFELTQPFTVMMKLLKEEAGVMTDRLMWMKINIQFMIPTKFDMYDDEDYYPIFDVYVNETLLCDLLVLDMSPMEATIKTTSKAIVEAPTTTIKVITIATKPRVVHSFEEVGATYAVICMVPIA